LALVLGLGLLKAAPAGAEISALTAPTCQSGSWPGKTYLCPTNTPQSGLRKAEFPDGRVQVFVVTTNQNVWTRMKRTDGTMTDWLNLGGTARNYPSAGINSNGKAYVDIVGTDGIVHRNTKQSPDEWSGWATRADLVGPFYEEFPTDNKLHGELVGRNMYVTDGPCKFYYKILTQLSGSTGRSTVTLIGDFLSTDAKCDLHVTMDFFNYDTRLTDATAVGDWYGIKDKDIYAVYQLGDLEAKTGRTLLDVNVSLSDYVGDVSWDAKMLAFDARPCSKLGGQGDLYCGANYVP
jgi:hypothetical protein